MPPVISDDNVKYAITDSVKTGSYPEAENVAAAEVHPRILPALHKDLQQARSDVEVSKFRIGVRAIEKILNASL